MSESPFEKTTETPPAADDLARTQESSAAGGTLFDPEGASAASARSALAGETALVPGAAPRVVTRAPSAVVPRTRRRGVIVAALGVGVAVHVVRHGTNDRHGRSHDLPNPGPELILFKFFEQREQTCAGVSSRLR